MQIWRASDARTWSEKLHMMDRTQGTGYWILNIPEIVEKVSTSEATMRKVNMT